MIHPCQLALQSECGLAQRLFTSYKFGLFCLVHSVQELLESHSLSLIKIVRHNHFTLNLFNNSSTPFPSFILEMKTNKGREYVGRIYYIDSDEVNH